MKFALALLITAFAALTVWGQAPTLHIVTGIPNLPSELYYGNIKVKPLRLRPRNEHANYHQRLRFLR